MLGGLLHVRADTMRMLLLWTLAVAWTICTGCEAAFLGMKPLGAVKGQGASREILQRSEERRRDRFTCELGEGEIRGVLHEASRTWTLTEETLRNVENDLQAIVNCSEAGDIILFDVDDRLQFPARVTLPWPLTLSGNVRNIDLQDRVFPAARRKQRIVCPRDGEGVFLVRARDILLANLVFEDCSFSTTEGTNAIVKVAACSEESISGTVRLHHVDFVVNRLERSVALDMNSTSCSALELIDVAFENNTCAGVCGAMMSTQNRLRNVTIKANKETDEVPTIPAVLYAPPESRTTAEGIEAVDNEGAVLHVDRGELEIFDSAFVRNEGEANQDGVAYGGGLHLDGASVTVRRCRFEENEALEGAGIRAVRSNLTVRDSSFGKNQAAEGGAGVYLFQCADVKIVDCLFSENSLPLLDGAAMSANSTESLVLKRSVFDGNKAGTGGALYVVEGPLRVEGCRFRRNNALTHGGALYFEGTTAVVRHSRFVNNSAANYGGAISFAQSEEVAVSNVTCFKNSANRGGCIRVRDSLFNLNRSVFRGNRADALGGGLSTNTTTASIAECLFEENSAGFGGGLDLDIYGTTEIRHSRIARNEARSNGAGARLTTGRFDVFNSSFEENRSEGFGGGLTAGDNADLTVNQSSFVSNFAENGGAGSNLEGNCTAVLVNSTWTSNRSNSFGGGVYVMSSRSVLEDSLFELNTAFSGAGVFISDGSGTLRKLGFQRNNGSNTGGAVGGHNATVVIADCHAVGNVAQSGGVAYFLGQSNVDITNLTALSNAASNGGALTLAESAASVSHSVFLGNRAATFAGTFQVSTTNITLLGTTVSNCSAALGGGALSAFSSSVVVVRDSSLTEARSNSSGGALSVSESQIVLLNTTVTSCQSERLGGGLYLSSSTAVINVSTFSSNSATSFGGGIAATDSIVLAQDLVLERNAAGSGAGGVDFAGSSSRFQLTNSTFEQNIGQFGGALVVRSGSQGRLIGAYALKNSASRLGGVAYVDRSTLNITSGQFAENNALFGGDVVVANSGRLNVQGATFQDGAATTGGGCLASGDGSFIVIDNSTISASKADNGGAVYLEGSYFWGRDLRISSCQAEVDGGAMVANLTSSVLCLGCFFVNNSAGEKGGAVYLESTTTQLLAYQFDDCRFEDNSAVLGGALHFVNEDRLVNCSEPRANCTFLALRGSRFVDNEALTAGGAVLASDLNSIRVDCSHRVQQDWPVYMNRANFETLAVLNSVENICRSWTGNKAGDYGVELASYGREVRKVIRFEESGQEEEMDGNIYFLQNHLSGSQLPSLLLTVVDEAGQGPAIGAGNETVVATMWSPDGLFTGSLRVRLEDGVGNFSGVSGYQEPGVYDVRVEFSSRSIPSFTIIVDVRRCNIGEAAVANGTVCQRCSGDSFNFYPDNVNASCTACPEDAKCDTAFIRPRKGHWHGNPCSQRIQECLTRRACDDDDRDERLKNVSSTVRSCNFTTEFIEEYKIAECKKGYSGPLCGSCDKDFGRSRAFRCERCFRGFSNFVLVLLSVLVLMLLSAFAIRSSLPSHRRNRGAPGDENGDTSTLRMHRSPSSSSVPVNVEMVEMLRTGHVPPEVMEARKPQQVPQTPEDSQNLSEIIKWKAVEIFKITVNFLQVIAIAISVNVKWTDTLLGVFETAEFIGGVTSEAATRSVDCLISSESAIPRSAVRTVVSVMVPMLVTASYFIFWAIVLARLKKSVDYLIKRCVLSFMAVAYLSYIALTKTVVNVLSCVDVHDSAELGNDSTTSYWAIDTALECYEDSHAVLAALIGWPTLFVFSFGFPISTAAVLLNERNKHSLKSEWLFESMGFMYRAYSGNYVFWESVIMLRKAVLAVVVVFSYSLGGNLQGVLGVCVLMVALYFQTVCGPFRPEFEDLNYYEGFSLLVSALTFVSGLFFNDDRTSDVVRILLTVFIVIANVGLFLFFLAMFWKISAEYLKTLLDAEGTAYNPEKGALHIVRTYMSSRFAEYGQKFFARFRTDRTPDTQMQPL